MHGLGQLRMASWRRGDQATLQKVETSRARQGFQEEAIAEEQQDHRTVGLGLFSLLH